MLMALLKGKLSREQENMEDILTSNVFGLFQYLPAELGLLPFLACAEDTAGNQPLAFLVGEQAPASRSVDYEFWPWFEEPDCIPCEPDALLYVELDGRDDLLILIEAKYLSGKSSEADDESDKPTDQLAREWDNLTHVARQRNATPILIYLTADMAYPTADISPSVQEYESKRPDVDTPTILWLTWRRITDVFQSAAEPILQDLVRLIKRLNLIAFEGFQPLGQLSGLNWRFELLGFDWGVLSVTGLQKWSFQDNV